MDEVHKRLQSARQKLGYSSATEAARAFGWNENTYRSHENGERGLKYSVASKYARAFRVDLGWLMSGTGTEGNARVVRVGGVVLDRSIILDYEASTKAIDVILPFDVPVNAACLIVDTDLLYPRYMFGDCIIAWNSAISNVVFEDSGDLLIEGIVLLRDDREFLGSIRPQHSAMLEMIGQPPMRDIEIKRFIPIQAVVRMGLYITQNFDREEAED